jgi:hypothetical protein
MEKSVFIRFEMDESTNADLAFEFDKGVIRLECIYLKGKGGDFRLYVSLPRPITEFPTPVPVITSIQRKRRDGITYREVYPDEREQYLTITSLREALQVLAERGTLADVYRKAGEAMLKRYESETADLRKAIDAIPIYEIKPVEELA